MQIRQIKQVVICEYVFDFVLKRFFSNMYAWNYVSKSIFSAYTNFIWFEKNENVLQRFHMVSKYAELECHVGFLVIVFFRFEMS